VLLLRTHALQHRKRIQSLAPKVCLSVFLMRRYLVARSMGGSPLQWHELSRFADETQWRYFLCDIEDGITNRVVAGLLAGAPVQRHNQPSD